LVVLVAGLAGVVLVSPAAEAAYPGGDGRIAFVRNNQIYTMTAAGKHVAKLTHRGVNSQPTWSPDGTRISFIREYNGRTDVWVMNAWGHQKRNVTKSGDVTSAGASWSPDGKRLAFARGTLQTIRSTAPFGAPVEVLATPVGGECDDPAEPAHPLSVDRFVAWAPDGVHIAIFNHSDCVFDDRIDVVDLTTHQAVLFALSGADCCGYLRWTDLFWGPDNAFGVTQRDTGQFGESPDAPTRILYPGFASRDHDAEGAPSPSGRFMALTSTSTGNSKVIRARADGFGRKVLANGSQPDWQPRP
jgi:hypothetical protein